MRRRKAVPRAMIIGLASTACLAQPASAQPVARAIWDRFVEICPVVVAADDPAIFAARLDGMEGAAGQTPDGAIRTSTMQIVDLGIDAQAAVLMTFVNSFAGGQAVQCMLQVIDPEPAPDGLAALVSEEAGRVLGEDAQRVAVGGPAVAIRVDGGLPAGLGESGEAEMMRVSTDDGFPPSAVINLQVVPRFVALTLNVLRPAAD